MSEAVVKKQEVCAGTCGTFVPQSEETRCGACARVYCANCWGREGLCAPDDCAWLLTEAEAGLSAGPTDFRADGTPYPAGHERVLERGLRVALGLGAYDARHPPLHGVWHRHPAPAGREGDATVRAPGHEQSEFKQCDPSCPGWEGLPYPAPPSPPPEVVSILEQVLAKAPREELVCFTRTLLVAMRTGEPVAMRVTTAEGPRTFMVVAAELRGELSKGVPHGGG